MENQIRHRLIFWCALALVMAGQPASAQSRKDKADSLVRLMKAESLEQMEMHGQQYRKAINSTFLHNGTYLISDTALWNVDKKIINAMGHVKVIQDETILTSDKLDYLIDEDLAKFRGTLVQLENKKKNLLRTRHLDYNTKDSMAVFKNGASMRSEDGQVIESVSGTYSSAEKKFTFEDYVDMFSDSMFVKTQLMYYYSETEKAEFPTFIDFWRGGNMLSADQGWYDRGQETVFFTGRVHGMSEQQEAWSDSLYYYKGTGDMLMIGRAQIQDSTRRVNAVADRIHYNDTLSRVMLLNNAAVVLETGSGADTDTLYIGADTLIYRTVRRCDIPDGTVKACESRLADILTDPVTEFRRKAAEAAAAAAAEAAKPQGGPGGQMRQGAQPAGAAPQDASSSPATPPAPAAPKGAPETPAAPPAPAAPNGAPETPEPPAAEPSAAAQTDSIAAEQEQKDSLFAPLTNALAAIDSMAAAAHPADSLAAPADTVALKDSLAPRDTVALKDTLAPRDTAALKDSLAPADSLAAKDTVQLDTTKIGFVDGVGDVRIFRKDIQVRCDSLSYCDLDSIARFYLDPIIWNDGNRQYTSDSLFMLIGKGGPRKASLQSNAFIVIKEDEQSYDQIKGTEVMAYFDSLDNSLKRFDALGGASVLFYLQENGVYATVNKAESKMMSGLFSNGEIDHVYYFEAPKNHAYPVVQLPESDRQMKGFAWRPDERPRGPEDITTLKVRPCEREYHRTKPKARFKQTEIYFPGYIKGIRREIAIRDSLAKLPKPKVDTTLVRQLDSLAVPDSLSLTDSLGRVIAASDSLGARDSLALRDSLATGGTASPADSAAVSGTGKPPEEIDPLAVPTVDPKQKRQEERELKRKLRIARRDARIAAREARWAELDKQDSLKLEAKKLKELEKQRAKTRRILLDQRRQDAKDQAKLLKYIEKYRKKYEREQKRKASRKRTQEALPGREVPTDPEPAEQAPRGDAVLGEYGTVDDDTVLSSGRVPRP